MPVRGATVTRPCFVTDGHRRLMLPAFGAYTGGLDIADAAISGLFPKGARIFLLGRDRLYHFQLGRARAGSGRLMRPGLALLVLLGAAILEAGGDAIVRRRAARREHRIQAGPDPGRRVVLMAYGVTVNLPPWDFGRLLGIYVTLFFLVAQVINALAFGIAPSTPILVGGALVIAGGLVMTFWMP